ncbi:MotR [Methylovorus sp. MM2]|uniref:MinD/ParA family ATP-binding protein n=1 Tax=Methylovorus sp. MM2 TaxID=1848038 RepID=UPI0007E067EE|nr:MotR [Methylovorus sp. MM2]OAM51285.1 MotR [Methylovorus sp. MM2]
MPNFHKDQAYGLRRIMAKPKPRIVSVISASPTSSTATKEQTRLITNLAASIGYEGNEVLIVAAHDSREAVFQYGMDALPSLVDVVYQRISLDYVIRRSEHGYAIAKLSHKVRGNMSVNDMIKPELNRVFTRLANQYEMVLVDVALNSDNTLPLETLNDNEIVIQLTRDPESIKQAYMIIKQVASKIGNRPFGILVSDATESQSEVVFRNISHVAKHFLQIELEFLGTIPSDEHIGRAAKLGRAVIEAFPMANASKAFQTLAKRLDYKQELSTIV